MRVASLCASRPSLGSGPVAWFELRRSSFVMCGAARGARGAEPALMDQTRAVRDVLQSDAYDIPRVLDAVDSADLVAVAGRSAACRQRRPVTVPGASPADGVSGELSTVHVFDDRPMP